MTAPADPVGDTGGRVPGEFAYWDHVGSPAVQRARRAWQTLFRFDPQPDDCLVTDFADAYYQADPVAEAFVDDVYLTRGPREGRAMLDRAIAHGVDAVDDAPESMRVLFDEFERPPDWLDPALVELGARVFRRWGTAVFSFATTTTLEMYSESSIAKPLVLAGGYAGETAHRRQLETTRFWIDVSEPGGLLDPASPGRATAMRVRIMHVFVRRRIAEHPEWDEDAWGVPISVADATLTLMGGSIVPGLGLWSAGYQTTIREIEALLHFWRYAGHLLGVAPSWYPLDFRAATQLMFAAFVKRTRQAGTDGELLVESYLPAFAPTPGSSLTKRLRDEINYRVQIGYTRYWSIPSTYGHHDMPTAWPWALHPLVTLPVVTGLETARRFVPGVDTIADRVQRWRRNRWYEHETGGRDAEFQPPERLTR